MLIWKHLKPPGRFVCQLYVQLSSVCSRYDQLICDF